MEKLRPAEALQTLQALTSAYELKAKGGLSEDEFSSLKTRLLAAKMDEGAVTSPTSPHPDQERLTPDPALSSGPSLREAMIVNYAGDLHRMIVQAVYRIYPGVNDDAQEQMRQMVTKLVAAGALTGSDVPLIHRVIGTVCQSDISDERMCLDTLVVINDNARLNPGTSPLGRTITAIAVDSAQNATMNRIKKVDDIAQQIGDARQTTAVPSPPKPGLWTTVKDDVTGALVLSAAVADGLQLEGYSGLTNALVELGIITSSAPLFGLPSSIAWPTIAVLGAGAQSGIAYALRRGKG